MICRTQNLPSVPKCHFSLSTLFSRDPCVSAHSPQPDPQACSFHRSHPFELPITLRLARRLGAFEFVQPTIQRLGSLHPVLLDLDFGIILHTDSSKEQLLYQIPMPPGSSYLFILHFPSYTVATTWEEAAEALGGTRSFTHAAQLLPRGLIYWKFHNFVFPSKPSQQELKCVNF